MASTRLVLYALGIVRRRSLIFLVGALGLLFVLASSVGTLVFAPGRPLDLTLDNRPSKSAEGGDGGWLFMAFRILLSLAIIAVPIVLIVMIVRRQGRRQLIALVVIIALAYLLLSSGIRTRPGRQTADRPVVPPIPNEPTRSKMSEPPDPPLSLISLLASLLIAVAVVGVVIWIVKRRQIVQETGSTENELASTATDAADALRRGEDIQETIQRCYVRMCEVLQEEHGVERPVSMTPSAFQSILRERNVPDDASRTLTRLFEHSRYGGLVASEDQQRQAIESLDAIAMAVR